MDDIERQWQFVLNQSDPCIVRIAERASREPKLRRLFPYPSMTNLRFSRSATYPYDPMPYILTDVPGLRYEVRDADNKPLAQGTLDEVVCDLAQRLA
jgi:hypothetical protein